MSATEHAHPKDSTYIGIAGFLAVVTALEVALSYVDLGNANAPLLLIGMVIKFFVVAAYFMHLKFDNKIFQRLLITGLVLAVACYVGLFSMYRQFDKPNRQQIRYTPSGIPQS